MVVQSMLVNTVRSTHVIVDKLVYEDEKAREWKGFDVPGREGKRRGGDFTLHVFPFKSFQIRSERFGEEKWRTDLPNRRFGEEN
ncbi:hypothetical protein HanXRQr2_Chr13g0579501 [Helianthus annuus]|uniref:Uncharacterized protein n=1 Tax=Helianthus annuus TaxID=4232 RepID=A0A9K3EFH9_HELAN|nr:hypothetical protein HanXRQr2_Chr13g0579501 [Helianthus annuus]KAJ0480370.1 hypothetical protein HanIR_Chr13g0630871 [Helianthus annuus]KAJ0848460.1 hypothetical protein HanPSC8_Chr13g0557681 [Helianthus annuus]